MTSIVVGIVGEDPLIRRVRSEVALQVSDSYQDHRANLQRLADNSGQRIRDLTENSLARINAEATRVLANDEVLRAEFRASLTSIAERRSAEFEEDRNRRLIDLENNQRFITTMAFVGGIGAAAYMFFKKN